MGACRNARPRSGSVLPNRTPIVRCDHLTVQLALHVGLFMHCDATALATRGYCWSRELHIVICALVGSYSGRSDALAGNLELQNIIGHSSIQNIIFQGQFSIISSFFNRRFKHKLALICNSYRTPATSTSQVPPSMNAFCCSPGNRRHSRTSRARHEQV